jgi:hypothetical protein
MKVFDNLRKRGAVSAAVPKIVCFFDWQNLVSHSGFSIEQFSLEGGFRKIIKQLTEIGQVIAVFVLGPPAFIDADLKFLHDAGFWPISCPLRTSKKSGQLADVVDNRLIALFRDTIEAMPGIDYICLGSGDSDFIGPVAEITHLRGKKLIIVAGSLNSLSPKLKVMADLHPRTRKPMVYFFSPVEEGEKR